MHARPLRPSERVHILRAVVREAELGALESGNLLLLLTIGVGAFGLGWFCALPSAPGPASRVVPVETER